MKATVHAAQLRKGVLEFCVMALLEQDEQYGLRIAARLREEGLISGEGTIYPLLARLQSRGLVRSSLKENDEGPPRRYYELTKPGKRQLKDFRATWASFTRQVEGILGGE